MNGKQKKIIISIIIVILVSITLILIIKNNEKITYASSEIKEDKPQVKISKAQLVENLDEIIQKNSEKTKYREEIGVEEEELEYITKYRNSDEIYIGETRVSQEGRMGIQAITTKRVYDEENKLVSEEQVSAVVVKSSINKIIDIGTKVRPKKNVQIGTTNGLSFDMALDRKSGFTLEQFKKALTDSKDKNKIFEENAKYFYYIEDQYNINGLFVAAVGIHESGWGTSKIALKKYNLFGYGAYDSNPYNGAYTFDSYAESIDLISRVFVKYYLKPSGTKIYGNETAKGTYYNGNTLSAINKKYATDKNWANGVYSHLKYLYNKI